MSVTIKAAWIGFFSTIIAALIGVVSNYYQVTSLTESEPKTETILEPAELKPISEKKTLDNNHPILKNTQVISVLEEQVFELCGYKGFTAKVIKKIDGKQEINIRNRNRNIPGSEFRVYEIDLPIEQVVKLWPRCTVSFKLENLASTELIVISLLRR